MQTQMKKKRPMLMPLGLKQFVFASALFATLFGWQVFAQSDVLTQAKPLAIKKDAQATKSLKSQQKQPKPTAVSQTTSPPPYVAVTRSSR
jgi:hypothetical protein